jgi:hypothetical protein
MKDGRQNLKRFVKRKKKIFKTKNKSIASKIKVRKILINRNLIAFVSFIEQLNEITFLDKNS